VEVVGDGRMMAKLSSLMNHASHPMHNTLAALQLLQPPADSSPVSEGEEPQVLPSAAVRLHNTLQ